LNSGKIWKIWNKTKLNSEMICKIWKKSKLNNETLGEIQKKVNSSLFIMILSNQNVLLSRFADIPRLIPLF
jgi:hypothetical protein